MGRVWLLAGALVLTAAIFWVGSDFLGTAGMLTLGLCIGAGVAAAYIQGEPGLGRGLFLLAGVFVGALGFVLGAAIFPDTNTGLFLGAAVPWIIMAVIAMWSKRQEMFVAMVIGGGAIAGVYANDFDLDPQSINVSLVIALGTTILPLGFGYLAGVVVRSFVPYDPPRGASAPPAQEEPDDLSPSSDTAELNWEGTR
jgi:hypothetical protein